MKKFARSSLSLLLLLSIFVASIGAVQAAQVEPRYTGVARISSNLIISESGAATCGGSAALRSGYTADLTVELKRDGTTIKTWATSGSTFLHISETYYVTPGHTYVVTTTVTVYDSNGKIVESPSIDSRERQY